MASYPSGTGGQWVQGFDFDDPAATDVVADSATSAWSTATMALIIEDILLYNIGAVATDQFDFVDSIDGAEITLKDLVSAATEADEFDFAGASDTATLSIGRTNYQEFSGGIDRSEERRVGKECRSRWSP